MNFRPILKPKPYFQRLIRSVWLFPLILAIILISLTALRISGTSIGHYHALMFGAEAKDPALITGDPRAIRSDEWGVNTPLSVSQAEEGFPSVNRTTGNGQDVTISFDVPYKDWSTAFKPQNWAYFILPLEQAFAFKWWMLSATLLLACYFFCLTLLPGNRLIATLLSIGLYLSPFLHWWYQSGSFLSLAYVLFIAGLSIRIIRDKKTPEPGKKLAVMPQALRLAALAYALTCFAFIAYVPFIVPLALVTACLLTGYVVNILAISKAKRPIVNRVMLIAIPAIVSGILFLTFLQSHSHVISALSQSVYPGDRTEPSGGYNLSQLMGGFYNVQLQSTGSAVNLPTNQSESASFILLFPFFVPLFVYLLGRRRHLKLRIDLRIIALLAICLLFLARLFVPATEILFNALQISRIPHNRLIIGFGLLNIVLTIISIRHIAAFPRALPAWLRNGSAALAFGTVLVAGLALKFDYQGYLESLPQIILVSLIIAGIVWLLLGKRFATGLLVLVIFSLLSVARINPLYQGLSVLTNSKLVASIDRLDDDQSKWVVGDYGAAFESLPAASGAISLSGVYAYPQLEIWQGIGADPDTRAVYNRYAHVFFTVGELRQPDQNQGAYFDPPALDAFRVHAGACSDFLRIQNVRFVILTVPSENRCLELVDKVSYPKITFYIYEITH